MSSLPPSSRKVPIPKRVHRPFSQDPAGSKPLIDVMFQSPNGFIGLSAYYAIISQCYPYLKVSIPKRVHRPFSRSIKEILRNFGSVSIPKRVHRPFSHFYQRRHGLLLWRFNPQTGSSAFQPQQYRRGGGNVRAFQSPNGFIGLSAAQIGMKCSRGLVLVSIPKRVHRPFSLIGFFLGRVVL